MTFPLTRKRTTSESLCSVFCVLKVSASKQVDCRLSWTLISTQRHRDAENAATQSTAMNCEPQCARRLYKKGIYLIRLPLLAKLRAIRRHELMKRLIPSVVLLFALVSAACAEPRWSVERLTVGSSSDR